MFTYNSNSSFFCLHTVGPECLSVSRGVVLAPRPVRKVASNHAGVTQVIPADGVREGGINEKKLSERYMGQGRNKRSLPLLVLENSFQLGTLVCNCLPVTDGLWRWEGIGESGNEVTSDRPCMIQSQLYSRGTTWHLEGSLTMLLE